MHGRPGERPPRIYLDLDVRIKGLRLSRPAAPHTMTSKCRSRRHAPGLRVTRARVATADALNARVREKEATYGTDCKALGHHFVPFIVSTDGVPCDPDSSEEFNS